MKPLAALPSLVLAFSLLAVAPARAALFHAYTNVYDGTDQVEDNVWAASTQADLDSQPEAVPGQVAAAHASIGVMDARAVAEPLALRVQASGSWNQEDWLAVAPSAGALVEIQDQFTLIDPTGTATAASRAFFSVAVDGMVLEDRASVIFSLGGSLCPTGYACMDLQLQGSWVDGVHEGADLQVGYLSSEGVLPFNTPIDLVWYLNVGGGPALRSDGSFSANLARSALWGGITLLDAEGQPIEGIQLVSGSDINWLEAYAAPVPEPAAGALLSGVLARLAWRRRPRA